MFMRSSAPFSQRLSQHYQCLTLLSLMATGGLIAQSLPSAHSQEDKATFDQKSLAARTTLFHEPLATEALKSLVDLYRQASRTDELIRIYRDHVDEFPDDLDSQLVYLRILHALERREARPLTENLLKDHAEDPRVQRLAADVFLMTDRPRSTAALRRAISLTSDPSLQQLWMTQLLAQAPTTDPETTALIEKIIASPGLTTTDLISWAELFSRAQAAQAVLLCTERALPLATAGEDHVSLTLLAATAEIDLSRASLACQRLETLLPKLAADHPRRSEAMRRLWNAQPNVEARNTLVQKARTAFEKNPQDEVAALTLAQWLITAQERHPAIEHLRTALSHLPHSAALERILFSELDQLGDISLSESIFSDLTRQHPERADLEWKYVTTLFLKKDLTAAEAKLNSLCEKTPPEKRHDLLIALARELKQKSAFVAATSVFEKIIDQLPLRLDLRREALELADLTANLELRTKLLASVDATEAETEFTIEWARYLQTHELAADALRALEQRRQKDPRHFELLLRLASVHHTLGNPAAAQTILEQARSLADTTPRYARWLDSLMAYQTDQTATQTALQAEWQRLEKESPSHPSSALTPALLDRWNTLLPHALQTGLDPTWIDRVRSQLTSSAPELQLPLKRWLAESLSRHTKSNPNTAHLWQELITLDPLRADEYRVRQLRAELSRMTSLMTESGPQRSSLTENKILALVASIQWQNVDDPALLRSIPSLLDDFAPVHFISAIWERLIQLEPTVDTHTDALIQSLARQGDEEKMRKVLLAELQRERHPALTLERRDTLTSHFFASLWRSLNTTLLDSSPSALQTLSDLLAESEVLPADTATQTWLLWTRAIFCQRSQNAAALAEVTARLRALGATEIIFPQGLALHLESALNHLLLPPAPVSKNLTSEPLGPASSPTWCWGFSLDPSHSIAQVLATDEYLFVLDDSWTVHQLDPLTGKLTDRFSLTTGEHVELRPSSTAITPPPHYGHSTSSIRRPPEMLLAPDRLCLYACIDSFLLAYDVRSRRLLWKQPLTPEESAWQQKLTQLQRQQPQDLSHLYPIPRSRVRFDAEQRLIVYQPATDHLHAFDPLTGKSLWRVDLPPLTLQQHYGLDFRLGLEVSGHYAFVYGATAQLHHTPTGCTLWRVTDTTEVPTFPLGPKKNLSSPSSTNPNLTSTWQKLCPLAEWSRYQNFRTAHLTADTLYLGHGQSVTVIPLHLPTTGHSRAYHGFFLPQENSLAFISSNRLTWIPPHPHTTAPLPSASLDFLISPDAPTMAPEAHATNQRIYAWSSLGLTAFAHTDKQRLFFYPFPENLKHWLKSTDSTSPTSIPGANLKITTTHYTLANLTGYENAWMPASTAWKNHLAVKISDYQLVVFRENSAP